MNIKKLNVTFLIVLLLTMIILTACSGGKPEEVPTETSDNTEPSPANTETAPAVQGTEPESTTISSEEGKTTESTDTQSPAAQPVPETARTSDTQTPDAQATAPKPAEAQTTTETNSESQSTFNSVLGKPIAEQPVLLTSSGQSADVQMVKVLLDRAEIKYVINPTVKPEEIKDVKTLILAIGGSSKGLGAAGINAEDELNRTNAVIAKAKELKLKIISLHIGGEARRGELSDKFINASIPNSDYVIVVEDGNKDNLFTRLTDADNIPMDKVKKITEAVEPLKSAFK